MAGLTLQAAAQPGSMLPSSTLLEWGERGDSGSDPGDKANPGVLSDVFCRVGGPDLDRSAISVHTMVAIHSGHVIGDNLWLWRADHSQLAEGEPPRTYPPEEKRPSEVYHLVTEGEYTCATGLHVGGDDVTMYGLAVEHTTQNQTVWTGERGKTFFYQCELPYDVSQAGFGDAGFVGYSVDDAVDSHLAVGVGIYSFFRDHQCLVPTAIRAPTTKPGVVFQHPFIKHLNGHGSILSILNGQGPGVGAGIARLP